MGYHSNTNTIIEGFIWIGQWSWRNKKHSHNFFWQSRWTFFHLVSLNRTMHWGRICKSVRTRQDLAITNVRLPSTDVWSLTHAHTGIIRQFVKDCLMHLIWRHGLWNKALFGIKNVRNMLAWMMQNQVSNMEQLWNSLLRIAVCGQIGDMQPVSGC